MDWVIAGMLRGKKRSRFLNRVENRFRRGAIESGFRQLRFEHVESRRLLTVLTWSPPANDLTPIWTATASPGAHKDWIQIINGQPQQVQWTNGDEADFPPSKVGTSANSPETVEVADAGATSVVFASAIVFEPGGAQGSYYEFTTSGAGSNDQLQVDPTGGTSIQVSQTSSTLPTVATFALPVVTAGSGADSVTIATGANNSTGTVVFTAPNTYTGGTYLAQGATLNINSIGASALLPRR